MEYTIEEFCPVIKEDQEPYSNNENPSKSSLTLVYVDDNSVDLWLAEKVFELSGINGDLLTATNGKEGFNVILNHLVNKGRLPEVIIADLQMPLVDGIKLMKKVKELAVYAEEITKLILISSEFEEEEMARIKEMGINCLLMKPLNEDDLIKILKS